MVIRSVLLVVPPLVQRKKSMDPAYKHLEFEYYRLVSPIELATMAADLLNRGFKPLIFDLGACNDDGFDELGKKLADIRPDAVVVANSILTFGSTFDFDGREVFERAREVSPNCVAILTGTHPTNYPGQAVKEGICHYSIQGEPDLVVGDLLTALNEGRDLSAISGLTYRLQDGSLSKSSLWPTVDLSRLPLPAYDMVDKEQQPRYYEFIEYGKIRFPEKSPRYRDIMTSRGCVLRCCFCNVAYLRGRTQPYRRKPLDMVIAEIEEALANGVEEIHFFDDLFVEKQAQIFELTDALQRRHLKFHWFVAQGMPLWPLSYDALAAMKETGMYRLICPFESGSNRVLKNVVGKATTVEHNEAVIEWARKLDLEIIGLFVVGMLGETRHDILQTIEFAESHPDIDYSVFSIATPLAGTRLTTQAAKRGLYQDQGQLNKVIKRTVALYHTNEFSEVELGVIRAFDWDRTNFSTLERRKKYARMVGLSLDQVDAARQSSKETFYYHFPDYTGPLSFKELCYQATPIIMHTPHIGR